MTSHSDPPAGRDQGRARARATSLFDPAIVRRAVGDSFGKLDPRQMMRNPVMFVVEIGSVLTTILFFKNLGSASRNENVFAGWSPRGSGSPCCSPTSRRRWPRAAARRRPTRCARRAPTRWRDRRRADGTLEEMPGTQLDVGDEVVVAAGEVIPGDGEVIEGIATVDESAITGESAPVIRESGGDRSAVTGGTRCCPTRSSCASRRPGETFLDRMIALVEGAERQKTPNEIALNILLAGLTLIFLLAVVTLQPFAIYSDAEQSLIVLVALLVCLIPTTIGALLSAIGIAGMDRLVQRNVLAMSGRAVEAAGDVPTLLLDKTGTITYGNRQAAEFLAGARGRRARARRGRAALEPRRRDARRSLDRRPRRGALRPRRRASSRRRAGAVHRADPDERRRLRRPQHPQGRGRLGEALGRGAGRRGARSR